MARTIEVPANRISQITARKRAVSADAALSLDRFFGTTPDLWMNLQKTYELDLAPQQLGEAISHTPQRRSLRRRLNAGALAPARSPPKKVSETPSICLRLGTLLLPCRHVFTDEFATAIRSSG